MKKPQFKTKRSHCMLYMVPILFIFAIVTKSNTSALTYQSNSNVDFTLNPTINVTLSSNDLVIDNLAPGAASDSNIITVDVSTNAGWGYYLAATANTSSGNTNLTHESSNTNVFSSLSSNVSDLASIPDNQWGYSYCNNGANDCSVSTNWVSGNAGTALAGYNGLPLDNGDSGATGVKLLSAGTAVNTGSIKFKIGAKAANTQAAGTYTGTVNFYAVTNSIPSIITFDDAFAFNGKTKYNGYYKMQDANASICSIVAQEQTGQLIDVRDNQVYTIAKLKDNKCWMTENLNIAGGTALSADTTDVDSSYISSFTTSGNLTKSGTTIVLPGSSTSGFMAANYSYVYNSGNKTNCGDSGQNAPCYSYYSWDAATLGSGRNISTENTDAPYSLCPKNWRLPTSGNNVDNYWKRGDFYRLATAYGIDLENAHYKATTAFYNTLGPNTTADFLLAGGYWHSDTTGDIGEFGSYWSSTSTAHDSKLYARYLGFRASAVYSAYGYYREGGFSVRCLFRD